MKRQIKFRCWDAVRGKMIDGIPRVMLAAKYGMNGFTYGHLSNPDGSENLILMQFTGLLDKNGKEIYEGDILKDDQGELVEVKFGNLPLNKSGDCVCTYEAWYGKCYGKLGRAPYYECQEIRDWMEVIGNVYENSEILTK